MTEKIPSRFQSLSFGEQRSSGFGVDRPSRLWPRFMKRAVDLLVSLLGLLLLAPFLGLIALFIALDSPGGVLYRQQRLGRNGGVFTLIKFRTMYQNADYLLGDALRLNPELRKEWECYQKLRQDPRVTVAGRLLRRFDLDELPQLLNVVKGEMSLVGPRPILVDQRELYGNSYEEYVAVLPGITGLWQVSGRNETTFARRAELDREYIKGWSVWLDTYILLKTVKVVLLQ